MKIEAPFTLPAALQSKQVGGVEPNQRNSKLISLMHFLIIMPFAVDWALKANYLDLSNHACNLKLIPYTSQLISPKGSL